MVHNDGLSLFLQVVLTCFFVVFLFVCCVSVFLCLAIRYTCALQYKYNTAQYTKQTFYGTSLQICDMKREKKHNTKYNTLWRNGAWGWGVVGRKDHMDKNVRREGIT